VVHTEAEVYLVELLVSQSTAASLASLVHEPVELVSFMQLTYFDVV